MTLGGVARYSLGTVGIFSVAIFLYATHNQDMWVRQLTKPWPLVAMIFLIFEAVWSGPSRTNISVLLALIFCLIGMHGPAFHGNLESPDSGMLLTASGCFPFAPPYILVSCASFL